MAYKNVGLAHMWMARVGEWVGEGLVQSHLGPRAQAHVRYAYLCIVCIYIYVHICTHIYIYIYMHIYIYILIYIYIYVCVFYLCSIKYVYIYIWIDISQTKHMLFPFWVWDLGAWWVCASIAGPSPPWDVATGLRPQDSYVTPRLPHWKTNGPV